MFNIFISFSVAFSTMIFIIIMLRLQIAWTEFQWSGWRAALKALFTFKF